MTIDQAYQFIAYVSNKIQDGSIKPADFNMLAPIAQISVINDLLGNEKQYRPHDPTPAYGYGITDKIRTLIRPLIVKPTATAVAAGKIAYPAALLYLDAAISTTDGYPITEASSDEIAVLNVSLIKPPSSRFPKYVMYSDGLYIYPTSITNVSISYVRRPAVPVWAYTTVNEAPVYNSVGSQDFELSELVHMRICAKILQNVGINLSDERLSQYAMAMEASGQ